MTLDLSRRRLLAAIGIASTQPVAATAFVTAPAALPRLTPETYLAEMRAIGWGAVAMVMNGKAVSVIERGPPTEEQKFSTWDEFRRIQMRVPVNDPTFWLRTARMLFDMGLREEVGRQ